jgi:hypothetical protein
MAFERNGEMPSIHAYSSTLKNSIPRFVEKAVSPFFSLFLSHFI